MCYKQIVWIRYGINLVFFLLLIGRVKRAQSEKFNLKFGMGYLSYLYWLVRIEYNIIAELIV